jgi:hypothetical protein
MRGRRNDAETDLIPERSQSSELARGDRCPSSVDTGAPGRVEVTISGRACERRRTLETPVTLKSLSRLLSHPTGERG